METIEQIRQKAISNHIPIIMDETLKEVGKILQELKPKAILEIGTAVGYSAIRFSKYLSEDGYIDTIERDSERVKEAKQNVANLNLENKIHIFEGCLLYTSPSPRD